MARPAARPRTLRPPEPLRPCKPEPRLLPLLLPIFILGFLSVAHIVSLAKLSMLEQEESRLDRLILAQKSRTSQLLREHRALTSDARLQAYAQAKGMVAQPPAKQVRIGLLPPPKTYWEEAEQAAPEHLIDGLELGQAENEKPGGG